MKLDVSTAYGVNTSTYTVVLNNYRRNRLAEVIRSFEHMTHETDEKPDVVDSSSSDDDSGDDGRGGGDGRRRRRKLDDDKSKKRKAKQSKSVQPKHVCPFYAKHQITKRKADKCHTPAGETCPKGRHAFKSGEFKKYKAKYD